MTGGDGEAEEQYEGGGGGPISMKSMPNGRGTREIGSNKLGDLWLLLALLALNEVPTVDLMNRTRCYRVLSVVPSVLTFISAFAMISDLPGVHWVNIMRRHNYATPKIPLADHASHRFPFAA